MPKPGWRESATKGRNAGRQRQRARGGTPVELIDKLNKEINAGLDNPKMKARLADRGSMALPGSPSDFGKLLADETEKWGKVIRAANIKPD
jgi:tripartite-type tricarboxylate transporter receptor subunit TctC